MQDQKRMLVDAYVVYRIVDPGRTSEAARAGG